MRKTTNRIVNRIPGFYTRNDRSVLISLIDSIVPEIDHLYELTQRVSDMISINKVHNDDIYERFGSMFNLYKYSYEDYDTYRARVRATVAERYGGVPQIIKNTVAGYAGITNSNDIENGIHVIGAWEYEGSIPDDVKKPGYFVVTIDANLATKHVRPSMLKDVVTSVKAAGVRVYLMVTTENQYDEFVINTNEKFWQSIKCIATDGGIIVGDSDLRDKVIVDDKSDTTVIDGNDEYTFNKGITKYESSTGIAGVDEELPIYTRHDTSDTSQFDVGIDLSIKSLLNDNNYLTNSTLITNVFKLNIKSTAEEFIDKIKCHAESEDSHMIMDDIMRSICDYINNIYESSTGIAGVDLHYQSVDDDKSDNISPAMTDDMPLTSIRQTDSTQLSFDDNDVKSVLIQKDTIDIACNDDISWSAHRYNYKDIIMSYGIDESYNMTEINSSDDAGMFISDDIQITVIRQVDDIQISLYDRLVDNVEHHIYDIHNTTAYDVGYSSMTINSNDGIYVGGNDIYTSAGTNNGMCKLNDTFITNLSTINSHYDIIKQSDRNKEV